MPTSRRRKKSTGKTRSERKAAQGQSAVWAPRQGRIASSQLLPGTLPHEQMLTHIKAFVDGAVEASGTIAALPDHRSTGRLPPLFIVLVEPDTGSALLEQAFALLDRHGAVAASEAMTVATAWTAMDNGAELSLIKLKLEFDRPFRGRQDIAFLGSAHAARWRHIAGGGLIVVTTTERLQTAGGPAADYAETMNAGLVFSIAASPLLQQLIARHGWPT
ncbi:hypothetical protein GCM10010156_72930 [Planobispora rosea]|uniref:Uncharacterized protein n=1 Tax=Planobispora rosea TaxID=35762 RepID=A0A8J3WGU6_PLARO|nr:hypothetical protein [Planobispora rosea]GGT04545.1 hypothetical protein GCM10010156_72930 [Planobispora rosea]GIH88895.1 hypothetical protein Pro02_73030 [Planobispora rosea]